MTHDDRFFRMIAINVNRFLTVNREYVSPSVICHHRRWVSLDQRQSRCWLRVA